MQGLHRIYSRSFRTWFFFTFSHHVRTWEGKIRQTCRTMNPEKSLSSPERSTSGTFRQLYDCNLPSIGITVSKGASSFAAHPDHLRRSVYSPFITLPPVAGRHQLPIKTPKTFVSNSDHVPDGSSCRPFVSASPPNQIPSSITQCSADAVIPNPWTGSRLSNTARPPTRDLTR